MIDYQLVRGAKWFFDMSFISIFLVICKKMGVDYQIVRGAK